MKKEDFNAWLNKRVETQAKITIAACAGMAALGLLAFVIQGGLLYLIFSTAYGSSFLGGVMVLLIFGAMGVVTSLTGPRQLADHEYEIRVGFNSIPIRLAPTLSDAWTFAMGSRDSDQSIPQRIISLMMMVPRLLWTSFYVFRRIPQVKEIHVGDCGKVLRMLLKKAERVEASEVAERYSDMDIVSVLRQISLLDGVVFLTKDSVGISLANRFKDALEEGLSGVDPGIAADASPFDG